MLDQSAALLAVENLQAWYGESHILHGVTFNVLRIERIVATEGWQHVYDTQGEEVATSEALARYFADAAAFLRGAGTCARNARWCDRHGAAT